MNEHTSLLGSRVEVKIDRPLGTIIEGYRDVYKEINAGYATDKTDGSGHPLHVYVLGVPHPLNEYVGWVNAIVKGKEKDSLVVCPMSVKFTKREIERKLLFVENFEPYEVIMEES